MTGKAMRNFSLGAILSVLLVVVVLFWGPLSKVALALLVVSFAILGYLGVVVATPERTMWARILTVVYFAYFILMPWYTAVVKTKPVPERVTG